jgi:polar amino acid transport system substrate-binding protein
MPIRRARRRHEWRRSLVAGLVALLIAELATPTAWARSLTAIRERGLLSLCAHANALPFSSRRGDLRGFQVELGEALAAQLGVKLSVEWVTTGYQFAAADCDVVLDSIAIPEAQEERRLRLSKPYLKSGVALAFRPATTGITGFKDLGPLHRVAVQVGSMASMLLDRRGVQLSVFGFEDEMLEAVARGEADAAAASPASAGYFNLKHPGSPLKLIYAYEGEPQLAWDVAVGLRRSDEALLKAVDVAIDHLLADGSIRRIYARYGIEHQAPSH